MVFMRCSKIRKRPGSDFVIGAPSGSGHGFLPCLATSTTPQRNFGFLYAMVSHWWLCQHRMPEAKDGEVSDKAPRWHLTGAPGTEPGRPSDSIHPITAMMVAIWAVNYSALFSSADILWTSSLSIRRPSISMTSIRQSPTVTCWPTCGSSPAWWSTRPATVS